MSEIDFSQKTVELLEEILKWVKFLGWKSAKEVLLDTLKDDISKLVYHYSDGSTSRDIAKKLPISHMTVTVYWKKWAKIGIVEPFKVKGGGKRYKKIFDLEEFGIEIPEIKESTNTSKGMKDEQ